MNSTRALLAALLLLAPAGRLFAQADDAKWKEALQIYEEDFKKNSIAFKKRAIEALPTNDKRTIDFIIKKEKLLESKDWWIRTTAADQLGKIRVPELRKYLHEFADDSKVAIRECIIMALGRSGDRLDTPVILKALDDKAWEVRRMAVWAAGAQRLREAVPKMIDMIHSVAPDGTVIQKGETHPRVKGPLLFNLGEITGKTDFFTDVEQWRQYWEVNKDRTLPEPKRFSVGTFGDVKLNYDDTFARRGRGHLVLVMPMPHYTTTMFMPYFNQWDFMKWLFINLPPLGNFPGIERDDGDIVYPVDILVDAFEDMRQKRNVEQFVLMGHGFSSWIAAKYQQKYPDRVAGLILLNPYASNETFGKRIDEAMRGGPDAEHWAKISRRELRPATPLEGERYLYYRETGFLDDISDIEMAMLKRVWVDHDSESILIPEFDIRGDQSTHVPTLLFFAPKNNRLTGFDDMNRLKRFYPKNITVQLRKSARLPFMEEPTKFEEALRIFAEKMLPPPK